jgi:hypothetical protein
VIFILFQRSDCRTQNNDDAFQEMLLASDPFKNVYYIYKYSIFGSAGIFEMEREIEGI